MLRLFFLLIASVSLLISCDKDEDGMYLSPNYCTATINGEEYAYQEHYAIPMMWGSWPDADYQTLYAPSFGVKMPLLRISTPLLPLDNTNNSTYYIRLYIKDFKIDSLWAGQTYDFTRIDFTSVDDLYDSISQEGINIAMVESIINGERTHTSTAIGNIRFGNHEGKWCNHDANECLEADFTLMTDGKDPIKATGHLYTTLKH